ncbi:Na+/H+ antiporter subunit E [Enemella sp. A6]|uniref:Na+/H+ antiporter subunit E n=1 Tax=Enemella sp. A6 TaxID=3440152 RepID=UPI003EB70300
MKWLTWPLRIIAFAFWFSGRLIATNVAVVKDVLTRRQQSSPVIVAYRTRCDSDLEVSLLTIMISLTPGTLMLAVRDAPHAPGDNPRRGHSGSRLYVHVMYARDRERALTDLAKDEAMLLWALRPSGGTR